MSVLRRAARHGDEARSYTMHQLGVLVNSQRGVGPQASTVQRALQDATTWACINVKAKSIAELPVDVVNVGGDTRTPAQVPRIISNPSPTVSRRAWTFQLAASLFTDGNAFGLVREEKGGWPSLIELVDPACVQRRDVVAGVKIAWVDGVEHRAWPYGDLWHMAGEMVMPGSPFGLSPVLFGSSQAGTALAAEEFGGRFFSEGGHPSAIIKAGQMPNQEQADALKKRVMQILAGGSREPLVLPADVSWEQISINPDDSQFIELMRWEVEQTCRRHGVPPSMVYGSVSGSSVTYSNVTQEDLHFLKHTLSYPISLIEDALSDLMPRPRVVKFNRDAILRADTLARYQVHEIALRNNIVTVDEVRKLEDMPPFGGAYAEPGTPVAQPTPAAVA